MFPSGDHHFGTRNIQKVILFGIWLMTKIKIYFFRYFSLFTHFCLTFFTDVGYRYILIDMHFSLSTKSLQLQLCSWLVNLSFAWNIFTLNLLIKTSSHFEKTRNSLTLDFKLNNGLNVFQNVQVEIYSHFTTASFKFFQI